MPLPSFPGEPDPDWNPQPSSEVPEEAIARPLPEHLVEPPNIVDTWKEIAS